MVDSRTLNHWLELGSKERIKIRNDGHLGYTTTSQYNMALMSEVNQLRAALLEAIWEIRRLKLKCHEPYK